MPDLATMTQLQAAAYRAIATTPGAKLDPRSIKKAGSLANINFAMAAALAQEIQARAIAALKNLTYQANGDALDAVVAERTARKVLRVGATPARVPVKIQRPGSGPGLAQTILAGEVIGDISGGSSVTFALDYDVPFAAGQYGPIYTTATATAAGSVTNVPQSAVQHFVSPASFTDLTFTVAATETPAGGGERENDAGLVARAQAFPASLQRGNLAAIEFGALTVPGVRQAVAAEEVGLDGQPTGVVLLYVADDNGNCNSALLSAVRLALRDWRAGGVPVSLIGSVPSYLAFVLRIGVLDGFSSLDVQALARGAVVGAVGRLVTNDTMRRSAIFAALHSVPGAVVGTDAIVSPALDVVPARGGTLRTRLDLITFA